MTLEVDFYDFEVVEINMKLSRDDMQNTIRGEIKLLNSEKILRYLIGSDDKLETTIICKPNALRVITTEQAIYEALGSIKEYDQFKLNKLVKLLEVVELRSAGKYKKVLKEEDVERIRGYALKERADN